MLAVSTDNQPTLNHWAAELKAEYPLLSDFMRKVSTSYGVLVPERGIASRTTFVIDPEGKIVHRYRKHRVFVAEGATTPYDVYDEWLKKVGGDINAFFPVADTAIGRIGTLLAFDGKFPEAGRALALNGAEIIYRGGEVELHRPAVRQPLRRERALRGHPHAERQLDLPAPDSGRRLRHGRRHRSARQRQPELARWRLRPPRAKW